MEHATRYRPRVGRETRLLVTTALLAVLALWMLARLRFPSVPAESGAVAGILSARVDVGFDALTAQVVRVRGMIGPSLFTVELEQTSRDAIAPNTLAAYRLGGDVAVVQVPDGRHLRPSSGVSLLAHDAASGLAVVRLPSDPAPSAPPPRVASPFEPPQYMVATAVYADGVAMRPVFIGAATRVDAPLWSASAYALPPDSGLTSGDFLFTREGEFAGLAVGVRGSVAFVAADTVLDEANRLIAAPVTVPLDYGVEVQPLNPSLSRALGAASGVVVTWVNPAGPSHAVLSARDLIEAIDGQAVPTLEHWRRHLATLRTLAPVGLVIRRSGEVSRVMVTPAAAVRNEDEGAPPVRRTFGATTTRVGQGSEVVAVEPASLAALAGLAVGDVITTIGEATAPTPSQVARLATRALEGQTVLVSVLRGSEHRLLVLEP